MICLPGAKKGRPRTSRRSTIVTKWPDVSRWQVEEIWHTRSNERIHVRNLTHIVTKRGEGYGCSCEFNRPHRPCVHVEAVEAA